MVTEVYIISFFLHYLFIYQFLLCFLGHPIVNERIYIIHIIEFFLKLQLQKKIKHYIRTKLLAFFFKLLTFVFFYFSVFVDSIFVSLIRFLFYLLNALIVVVDKKTKTNRNRLCLPLSLNWKSMIFYATTSITFITLPAIPLWTRAEWQPFLMSNYQRKFTWGWGISV